MSYFGRVIDNKTGESHGYHVNSRAKCKTCKVPLGVGQCSECECFAAAMEEWVQAVMREMAGKPGEELPY